MKKTVRVNIRSVINADGIRREKRNGRDVVIVPSATLPDNVVMNSIRYPADEIEKSYKSLERTPAPFGHPLINGRFVSARDPEGINLAYIGAHNENVRRENGRVFLDKVIDIEVANRTKDGKAVLSAIDKGDPIHTSTGLLCDLHESEGDDHKYNARNILFDHDAILLNEEGAATPEQGVGIFVNSKGEHEEIEVVNSSATEAMRDLDWAVDSAVRAMEKLGKNSLYERIKSAIMDAFASERETSQVNGESEMTVTKEQFDELSAKVNALAESITGDAITKAVQNAVKPLTDNLEELKANQEAKDEAEKAVLVEKVVKANLLDEETAKATPLNTLKALAPKAEPGKAAPVANGVFNNGKDDDEWKGYSINSFIKSEPANREAA